MQGGVLDEGKGPDLIELMAPLVVITPSVFIRVLEASCVAFSRAARLLCNEVNLPYVLHRVYNVCCCLLPAV